jgi:integrase
MPDIVAEALQAHRRDLLERQAAGLDTGYVFPSRTGGLHTSGCLTKPIRAALAAAGVTRRFKAAHGFRHTYNDLARRYATGALLREMLGHESAEMSERYSHAWLGEKRSVTAQVVRLVTGAGGE